MTTRRQLTIKRREGGNFRIPLREFQGFCDDLPVVGERFMVWLPEDRLEYLHTSEVISSVPIEEDGRLARMIVQTKNSIYDLVFTEESQLQ